MLSTHSRDQSCNRLYLLPAALLPAALILGVVFLMLGGCSKEVELPPEKTLTIKIVHSPEVRAYLAGVRELFMSSDPRLQDGENNGRGTKINVEFINEMGLAAADRIASGDIKPDGWLAPSTSVVNYANRKIHNLGSKQGECKALFATPVVLAAPRDRLSKIGAQANNISWNELFEGKLGTGAAVDDEALVAITHATPRHSTSGVAALLQLNYLAAPNTAAEFTAPALSVELVSSEPLLQRMSYYQSFVSGYGQSEGSLLTRSENKESRRVRLVLTTEQQVIIYNRDRINAIRAKNPQSDAQIPAPIVALYPREGSYWEDYNFCFSLADWITPPQRAATRIFLDFMASPPILAEVKRFGFRPVSAELAQGPPLDADFGVDLSKPTKSFLPVSGEALNEALSVWPKVMRPAAFVLVLDSSGSMEGASISAAKQQFRYLLAGTGERDLKALINFNTRPKLESGFTESGAAVIAKIDPLTSLGGSAIYDSIRQATELIVSNDLREYRKSIIVITDGDDKNSEVSKQGLIDLITDKFGRNDITLIVIGISGAAASLSDLEEITIAANGIFRTTKVEDLNNVFGEVLRNVQGII